MNEITSRTYGYFEQHLRDAIQLNLSRRAYYVSVSGWQASLLSRWLVSSEYLCLPLARYFDRKALPFNQRGIPIVENDFIDMAEVAAKETVPQFRCVASSTAFKHLSSDLGFLKKAGRVKLKEGDYKGLCDLVEQSLVCVLHVSESQGAHFAMTQHLLESLGYAALHAITYVIDDPQCSALVSQLVSIQLRLCNSGLMMDRLAQRCHVRGAGIVLNDVPHIPFLSEFNAVTAPKKGSVKL